MDPGRLSPTADLGSSATRLWREHIRHPRRDISQSDGQHPYGVPPIKELLPPAEAAAPARTVYDTLQRWAGPYLPGGTLTWAAQHLLVADATQPGERL